MTSDGSDVDNINEIADAIFSRPPGAPHSIQLELEEETADIAEKEGVNNFIFNILYMITFKGIEKMYGHKNVQRLTEMQFEYVQDYVKSYGYIITVDANNTHKTPWQLEREGVRVLNCRVAFDKFY